MNGIVDQSYEEPRRIPCQVRRGNHERLPVRLGRPAQAGWLACRGRPGHRRARRCPAFPESLAEFFVLSFCPPGGTVLDPFCGSGTTLAVAAKNGRGGIGIDVRQSQIDLTRRRLGIPLAQEIPA